MLNIKLNLNYKISSDNMNYTLQKVGTIKEGKNIGEETIANVGYYSTIENALKAYKQVLIRGSDIDNITELIKTIKQIDEHISEVLRGN